MRSTPFGFTLAGDYDRESLQPGIGEVGLFQRCLADTDVVIDVGANVGIYTCIATAAGVPTLAVEPHPTNVRLLLNNLTHNKLVAEVFPVALSDTVGVLPLFGGGQGATLLSEWGGISNMSGANYGTLVPVNTLDNVVGHRFNGQCLLIKIDVEGNEYSVMQGAKELLKRSPAPVWLIEHGLTENFGPDSVNPDYAALFELFWSHEYESFTADDDVRPISSADVARWLAERSRDFGGLNVLFRAASAGSRVSSSESPAPRSEPA